jgi:hypothetical protein
MPAASLSDWNSVGSVFVTLVFHPTHNIKYIASKRLGLALCCLSRLEMYSNPKMW